jgi:hypothetical protein
MRPRNILIGYGVIGLWTISPMISVLLASAIATAFGCALDEGGVNPCVVLGKDLGPSLYTLGVMGWFFLLTVPSGLIAFTVFTFKVILSARKRVTA